MGRFIGVDLHKNMFVVCFYEPESEEKKFKKYEFLELGVFLRDLKPDDQVAVEITTNTRYFYGYVRKYVSRVVIINTLEFKIISQSVKKTDMNDAEKIAYYLSKGMLPEVRMKDKEIAEIESLANTRDKLVKLRTVLKNKVHSLLLSNGILSTKESLGSEKGLEWALSQELDETPKVELEVLVEEIRNLNRSIKKLDETIRNKGKGLKGFENITSIKGIGENSGTILLSVIGNIDNFESRKKLDAYFGIVPRVGDSNETIRHGRITKRGNKLGRSTLVQCTLVAVRYSTYLKSFYLRLKEKKGAGKAIIATARKLLGIIYDTLKNGWVFEDFPNFILKNT